MRRTKKTKKKNIAKPTKQVRPKKIKIGKTVKKLTDAVKRRLPFGGKGGRKKKQDIAIDKNKQRALTNIQDDERLDREIETRNNDTGGSVGSSLGPAGGFFYTDEKFITKFEDAEIINEIKRKHPEFLRVQNDDTKTRKAVMNILNDERFLCQLLVKYQMTIMDFFKFLFRQDQSIFKTSFNKRVKEAIRGKLYLNVKRKY